MTAYFYDKKETSGSPTGQFDTQESQRLVPIASSPPPADDGGGRTSGYPEVVVLGRGRSVRKDGGLTDETTTVT